MYEKEIAEIKAIIAEELPKFWYNVSRYRILGETLVAIQIGASAHEINNVSGQRPQIVSLAFDPVKYEIYPQVFGGEGGDRIFRKPNLHDPKEKYLAMKSIKIPFRKPKNEASRCLEALRKFCRNYKKVLLENIDSLEYANIVDYKSLLS